MHDQLKQVARMWAKTKRVRTGNAGEADLMLEDALVHAGFPVVGDPIEAIHYRLNTVIVTLESELQITIPLE